MKKTSVYNLIGTISVIAGIILSIMLIQEYYGNKTQLASSICTATGEVDSCKAVAESKYSGFKNVPILGTVPLATLGFTFYGFLGVLFIMGFRAKTEEDSNAVYNQIFAFSILALIADVILLYISKFLIGKVCTLCLLTYVVSLSIFIVSFLGLKDSSTQSIFHRFSEVFMKTFIKNFINYTIIVLGFFACGMGIGQISQSDKTKLGEDPYKMEIQSAIKAYKSADNIDIDLKNVPMLGDENAKITIVKYADFNCGHCMYASHTLRTILAEFTGLVKVYYKNFPLDGNCNPAVQRKTTHGSSCVAAAASLCGNEQAKFYEVYTGLYNDTEKGLMHTPATVLEIAKRSGLNIDKFNTCMASAKVRDQIYAESVEGDQKLKIQSTPSLYINNKPIAPGNPNIEFLRALMKDLINENP